MPWWTFGALTLFLYLCNHEWNAPLMVFEQSLDAATSAIDEGSRTREFGVVLLAAVGLAAIWKTAGLWRPTSRAISIAAAAFLSWAAASALWSDDPLLTIRKLAVLFALVLAAEGLSRTLSLIDFARFVLWSSAAFLALGIAREAMLGTFAPFDPGYRFAGTLHPNHQAINCWAMLLSATFLARVDLHFRRLLIGAAACAALFLLLTKSRTAAAAAAMSLGVYAFAVASSRARRRAFAAGAIVAGMLSFALAAGAPGAVSDAVLLGRADSDPETLTGRVDLWNVLWADAQERPLAGYGYDSYWSADKVDEVSQAQYWTVYEGHSSYIDVLLGTGAVGLALFAIMLGVTLARSLAHSMRMRDPSEAFIAAIVTFAVLEGFLESALLTTSAAALLLAVAIAYERRSPAGQECSAPTTAVRVVA